MVVRLIASVAGTAMEMVNSATGTAIRIDTPIASSHRADWKRAMYWSKPHAGGGNSMNWLDEKDKTNTRRAGMARNSNVMASTMRVAQRPTASPTACARNARARSGRWIMLVLVSIGQYLQP